MNTPETLLKDLIDRDPTPEELAKIYKIRERLGLSDTDVVWSLLAAFHHYEILYSEIPAQIAKAAAELMAEFKVAMRAEGDAVSRSMLASMEQRAADTVAAMMREQMKGVQAIVGNDHKKRLLIGLAISLGVAAIAMLGLSYAAYSAGAASQRADSAWLQTPEGRAARQFAELNDVSRMLECPTPLKKQSKDKGTYCYPVEPGGTVRMWRIN